MIKFLINITLLRLLRYLRSALGPNQEDAVSIVFNRAAQSSADYIESKMDKALLFRRREALWNYAVTKAVAEGIWAEFGVYEGSSINHFAKLLKNKNIYGFDSFEGLKEDWVGTEASAGTFSLKGRLPTVTSNVILVKGWFDKTVPEFLQQHRDSFSFVHLDADTYESTALLLDLIGGRLAKGAVLIFDEYLGYPNWQLGEHLAWKNYSARHKVSYRYLAFSNHQAAIQIL